ncbi:uncharacterized protein [Musca autumnalis]|uniref:uncharacterized protein n=1 Tax=Musca autumnalis TaxID=221902 RepID=UPI003CF7F3E6
MSSSPPSQRQSMNSIHHKQFWTEFFCLYESQPALWDINSSQYKNRHLKCEAYDILVEKLREIEPDSDREDVLRKINIFRTNYRRECARINNSLHEGRPYHSTLWYFDLLSFLQTAESRRERKRKLVPDNGEKSIMRKRRHPSILKPTDRYAVQRSKDNITNYHLQITDDDFGYEKFEDNDLDYVVEDFSHALVVDDGGTTKTDSPHIHDAEQFDTTQDQHFHPNYRHGDDDDDISQVEYEHEYQHYSMLDDVTSSANSQRSSKIEHTSRDVTFTNSGLACSDSAAVGGGNTKNTLILTDATLHQQQQHQALYGEYDSDQGNAACVFESQRYKPKVVSPKHHHPMSVSSDRNETIIATSSNEAARNNSRIVTTKFVRDVKTMTSDAQNSFDKKQTISNTSEILAKSWALQYDELSNEQKILARKAIYDILFDACMDKLVLAPNGRVTTIEQHTHSSGNDESQRPAKCSVQHEIEEVESGNVYEQASSTSATIAIVADNTSTDDPWLKL